MFTLRGKVWAGDFAYAFLFRSDDVPLWHAKLHHVRLRRLHHPRLHQATGDHTIQSGHHRHGQAGDDHLPDAQNRLPPSQQDSYHLPMWVHNL